MYRSFLSNITLFLSVTFFLVFQGNAQDQFFSQIYGCRQQTNPAFTGSSGGGRISLNQRTEFASTEYSYQAVSVSYDHYLKGIGGLGVNYLLDQNKSGLMNERAVNVSYSYHFEFGNEFVFQPAIQLGWASRSLTGYFPDSTIDFPFYGYKEPYNYPNEKVDTIMRRPDISFGVLLYDKTFIAGLALFHLNRPQDIYFGDEKGHFPVRTVFHAAVNFETERKIYVVPNIMFMVQEKYVVSMFSFGLNYKGLVGALGYYKSFNKEGYNLHAKAGATYEGIMIGYSFDTYIAPKSGILGIHEIMLNFELFREKNDITALEIMAY